MFHQPRQTNDGSRNAVFGGGLVQNIKQFLLGFSLGVIYRNRPAGSEPSAAKRTPRQRRDVLPDTLIERSIIKTLQSAEMNLHLIHDQGEWTMNLERRQK